MIEIDTFDCEHHVDGGWTCIGKIPISSHNVKHLSDKILVKGHSKTVEFTRVHSFDTEYVFYYSDAEIVMLKWLID